MQIRLIVDQASLHQLYHLLEFMFLRRCFSTALFLGRVSNHLQTQKSRKERREKTVETGNENIDIGKPKMRGEGKIPDKYDRKYYFKKK